MALYEPTPSRKQLSGQLLFFGVWLSTTIIGLSLHADPSGHGTHTELGLPPCPSVLLFNRPCPGCGLTTSFTAFLHGDLAFAFHAHPLGPFMYLGMTLWAGLCIYGWFKSLRLDGSGPVFNRVLTAFMAGFFVFGIGRMALVKDYSSSPEQRYVFSLTDSAKVQAHTSAPKSDHGS